jgi:hypothetical protein
LLLVFFHESVSPQPQSIPLRPFQIFFAKFAEIFASHGAPAVSTTPVANFSIIFADVVDTGGKFATGVKDIGGKFATSVNDNGCKPCGKPVANLELRISPRICEKI